MQDIIQLIDQWKLEKKGVAVATVVKTWESAPRDSGARMVICESGEFVGSVSGGCVEGAVITEAVESIKNKQAKVLHYGVSDEIAWGVGLSCGGEIDVYVEPVDDQIANLYRRLKLLLDERKEFILTRVIRGPQGNIGQHLFFQEYVESDGTIEGELRDKVIAMASPFISEGKNHYKEIRLGDEIFEIFFEYYEPRLRLIIVGGVQISIALAIQAKSLGYQVIIVDPRSAFGTRERFPEVDGLLTVWPDQALVELKLDPLTAVAALTHDSKLDDPALEVALPSDAFYVGVLGGRTSQKKRYERLKLKGMSEQHLARLRTPIGLDLGGRNPEEIALSIMAEITAVRYKSPLISHDE